MERLAASISARANRFTSKVGCRLGPGKTRRGIGERRPRSWPSSFKCWELHPEKVAKGFPQRERLGLSKKNPSLKTISPSNPV